MASTVMSCIIRCDQSTLSVSCVLRGLVREDRGGRDPISSVNVVNMNQLRTIFLRLCA